MRTQLTLAFPAATLEASADVATRTVTGVVVPYGEWGYTSAGKVRVRPGALQLLDADLSRTKLVDEHQKPPVSIGYATSFGDSDRSLRASFHVAETPDGDRALAEAQSGARDAFSVELANVVIDAAGWVTAGLVTRVALVVTPAFSSSLLETVAASLNTMKGNTVLTADQIERLSALLANAERTPEEQTELDGLLTLAAPEGAPSEPDAAAAAVADAQTQLAASRQTGIPARVPAGAGNAPARRPAATTHNLRDFYAAQARVHRGESVMTLEAALSDITQTANVFTSQQAYAGELWSGLGYTRRYVPMMTNAELTSYKGTGWRWTTRPEVGDYAGDKAAVPSNAPDTDQDSWTAARLAGAHDIDRKFWDFGDTQFIESYYRGLTESYAWKSDLKARAFLIAAGAANVSATAPATPDVLELCLEGKFVMEDDETTGISLGSPDFYIVNATDYKNLIGVSAQNVSAFLDALGIGPEKMTATSAQPSGSVTVGVKAASTFYELNNNGAPIRVEAVNVANGGIDGGVFGYYATFKNAAAGLRKITAAP